MKAIKNTLAEYLVRCGLAYQDHPERGLIIIREPEGYWIANDSRIDNQAAVSYIMSEPPEVIGWPDAHLN